MAEIKLTQQQQYMVVIGAIVLVFLFWYYPSKIIGPIKKDIKEVSKQVEETRSNIARLRDVERNLDELKRKIAVLHVQVIKTEKILPNELKLDELILMITDQLSEHDIELRSLAPGKVAKQRYYSEMKFSVNAQALFRDLVNLFSEIGQMDQVFGIRDVVLSGGGSKTPGGEPNLNITFSIVAYMANK